MKKFDYSLDFKNIDFRANPKLYIIGKGEQGVLLIEPYKAEILPFWRFKTPEIATDSSNKIYDLFLNYKTNNDFIGMDMARKFLQMGWTRARRYANHKSGQKFAKNPQNETDLMKIKLTRSKILPQEGDWKDSEKAKSAQIFYDKYMLIKNDEDYLRMKKKFIEKYHSCINEKILPAGSLNQAITG